MATNFFERQDQARSKTVRLVVLFIVAVIAIVAAVVAITFAVMQWQTQGDPEHASVDWSLPIFVGLGTLAVILLGSASKVVTLRIGGGSGVAESMGGRRIFPDTTDPDERRILNVVEEMALASGTPVPPVFLLADEKSINAFAAGYSPRDAVLGITHGAVHSLTREQLQGVVAHEFSHILNGDMRLGIRMIGILHGILLLGLIGHTLFRIFIYSGHSTSRRSRSDDRSSRGGAMLVMAAVGAALIVLGTLGGWIGHLIKAAVSRQREFLADASAVQFTRNPQGLAGALKQIGAAAFGSRIRNPQATEASHLFFAKGVSEGFTRWMSTHPPLEERIRMLDPNWDGRYPPPGPLPGAVQGTSVAESAPGIDERRSDLVGDIVMASSAVQAASQPLDIHLREVAALMDQVPQGVRDAAHDPYGCRALVFALLLDPNESIRRTQLQALATSMDPALIQLTERMAEMLTRVDPRIRLPLVDVALPALRSMTEPQFQEFSLGLRQLIAADGRLNLFEWVLSQVVDRNLRSEFEGVPTPHVRHRSWKKLGQPCSVLLSLVAHVGHTGDEARAAFVVAASRIPEASLQWLTRSECRLATMQEALQVLRETPAKTRTQVLDACVACINADGVVTPSEAELLRGIADLLDCEMR